MGHRAFLFAAILAAVCGSPPWALAVEARSPPVHPPNVLLLTLDTTRADALGAFGGRGARTPVLDALAARGTRWEQAISSTPMTLPVHSSLFTGLAPPEHGVEINGSTVLPKSLTTLAEAFSARGYATWSGLVKLAEKTGDLAKIRAVLTRALEAGTQSPSILERLAAIEYTAGDTAAAERHRAEARRLAGR